MNEAGLLVHAFVYLAAAVIAVPLAQRLGMGSVLGYLLAGVAIGPFALDLLGTGGQDVMHFAEFGVVMMLFVIGLELQPALLWRLRGPILGLGGLQVVADDGALRGPGAWRSVCRGSAALAIGMTLALSSTAIVLQTLSETRLLGTAGGQSSFAVLLFQDIAVIPMLAIFPLLAEPGTAVVGGCAWRHATTLVSQPAGVGTDARGAGGRRTGRGRRTIRARSAACARSRERGCARSSPPRRCCSLIGIALADDGGRALARRSAPSSPASCSPTASTGTSSRATSSRSRACCSACSSSRWARRSTSALILAQPLLIARPRRWDRVGQVRGAPRASAASSG